MWRREEEAPRELARGDREEKCGEERILGWRMCGAIEERSVEGGVGVKRVRIELRKGGLGPGLGLGAAAV